MGMQYDVSAASNTASATFVAGPARVKGLVVTTNGALGSVVCKDGGSSGSTKLTINTGGDATVQNVFVPGEGVRFETDVYVALTNITSLTVFYG
jgi:hypothetical protein